MGGRRGRGSESFTYLEEVRYLLLVLEPFYLSLTAGKCVPLQLDLGSHTYSGSQDWLWLFRMLARGSHGGNRVFGAL